jgi:hypothetical protein
MQQWRKIYTNLFDNDELGVMGFLVRYLYIGTIVFADDLGRFKATPKWLRAKIFPYDDVTEQQISQFLQKLAGKNKIKLYEVLGEPYGQHTKWLKYNRPRKDRKQATNPPPPKTTNGQPDDNQAATNGQPLVAPEEKRREEKREDKIPPKIEEVSKYCEERKNGVNPSKWHDFYSSKGWMVGRNKMKDWRAAVRTWESSAPKVEPLPRGSYIIKNGKAVRI